jgi:hypothetical protein
MPKYWLIWQCVAKGAKPETNGKSLLLGDFHDKKEAEEHFERCEKIRFDQACQDGKMLLNYSITDQNPET